MKNSANKSLIDSVVVKDVSSIAQQIAETALDHILDEGILKDIPIVSWLVKACSIGKGIRDRIFLKKIALFICEAGKITEKEREAFSLKMEGDPDYAESTGETALLLLDQLSSTAKARLMGYAFRRYIQGDIDQVILNRIYAALEVLPAWMLLELPNYYFTKGLNTLGQGAAASFQQFWLVEVYYGDKKERMHMDLVNGGSSFHTHHQQFFIETPIGHKIAEVLRDYLAEPE